MARIYVSSTYSDLQEHREKVYRVLRQLSHDVVAMEDYVAADQRPLARCLADVAACQLYVGIFAHRYGYVPEHDNPDERSITELEYRHAEALGIPRLVFLLDLKTAWPPGQMDVFTGEGGRGACINALREELGRDRLASFFSTADELAQKVSVATSQHVSVGREGAAGPGRVPALDLVSYFRRLEQQYARLDLNALTPPQREEYLQILLRSVFIEQQVRAEPPPVELPKMTWELLRSTGESRGENRAADLTLAELYREREVYQRKPVRPVLDVLAERGNRLVALLGDPGAGKSTLARYLILSLVEDVGDPRLEAAFGQYLPLLVELRAYAGLRAQGKCDTFLGFWEYLGRTEGYGLTQQGLDCHLRQDGRALVIFDGLDELFDPVERETVSRQIAGFASHYEQVRVVVTSRIIGYRREVLDGAGFIHYTLQDLDRAHMESFIRNWYELAFHQRPEEAELRRRRLADAVDESQSIRELAGNPLLLTILAIIGKHQDLPRERWKLYDHAASVLVEHWDVNKHLADARIDAEFIDEEDKKELLRRVALRMQDGRGGQVGNYLPAAELQHEFEDYMTTRYGRDPAAAKVISQAMIRQFRERNFVLSNYGGGLYGFVHRAFLEYFCATSFVRSFEKSRQLTFEQIKTDVFGLHWEDEAWREVLRLVCGMLDESFTAELLDFLIEVYGPWPSRWRKRPPRNLILATGCLAEVRNLTAIRPQAERLLRALTALIEHLIRHPDGDSADLLEKSLLPSVAAVGPRWPGRELFRPWFRAEGLRVGWILGTPSVGQLLGALFSDSEEVREELYALATRAHSSEWRRTGLAGLVQGWPDHAQTLPLVSRCAVHDTDPAMRRQAIVSLSERWRSSTETLSLLRERFRLEVDQDLSGAIAQVLAEGWPNDPVALPALAERIQKVDDRRRDPLFQALATGWPDDPQTLPLLRNHAVDDPDGSARRAALQAIASGWRDDPQTLPLLRDRAVDDPDSYTRGAALQAIATGWRDDPQTLVLLRDRAVDDPDGSARGAALQAIASGWPDDPQTRVLLGDRAVDDPDGSARGAALEAIATGWRDDPQTLVLLRDRAVDDPDGSARRAALEAIATGWPDDPQTLPLLRDRAVDDPDNIARAVTLQGIATGWRDDPQTLPLLRDRAVNDPDNIARAVTLQGIARRWPDDPQTLPLLCDRAVNDAENMSIVGAIVLQAITTGWPDDPQTLPLLRDRATSSPDAYTRGAALQAIATGWRDDPQMLVFLRDRAVDDPDSYTRGAALQAIATGWRDDPQMLVFLRDRAVDDPDGSARGAALQAIATGWRDDPQTLVFLRHRAVDDPDSYTRGPALQAIATGWRDDPQTLVFLRDRAVDDPDGSARGAALKAIATGWRDDPQTLPLLRDRAVDDPDGSARGAALQAIATGWRDDPQTLVLLRDRAVDDPDSYTRGPALQAIATGWRDDPQTLPLLRDRAVDDPDSYTRGAALQAIATGWRDDPQTLVLLRDRVDDPDGSARGAALKAIATGWRDEPQTLPLLRDRAVDDPDGSARGAALQAIATGWRDEPQTLPLMRDRAVNDPDGSARRPALQAIATGWRDDPQTLPLMRDRAVDDPDGSARGAALQAIASGWRDEPQTLPLLRDRAVDDPDGSARRAALQAITSGWRDDPQTLVLLRDRAVDDPDSYSRGAALQAIATGWRDEPQTLPLLRDRAVNDPDSYPRWAALQAITSGWPGEAADIPDKNPAEE